MSTPYHWTFQMLWVMYWLSICVLVCFTTWLLVVQPVRSAKQAAKVRSALIQQVIRSNVRPFSHTSIFPPKFPSIHPLFDLLIHLFVTHVYFP